MKFHSTVLVLALLGFALGDFQDCTYTSSDGYYVYDLNSLFGAYTFGTRDQNGAVAISFSICGPLSSVVPSIRCDEDSAACFFPNADDASIPSINIGNWDQTLFSDSEAGTDQGLELVYASPSSQMCDSTGRKFKTSLKLQCDYDAEFVIDSIESPTECDTIISINSSFACPASSTQGNSDYGYARAHRCNKGFVFVVLGITTLCCCCVCCIRRNRRCAMRRRQEAARTAAAVEMTSSAFKPVEQSVQPLLPPVPQFVQYMQQPAYVPQYFYVQPQPIVEESTELQSVDNSTEQVVADEQLAKALQAHFDQE